MFGSRDTGSSRIIKRQETRRRVHILPARIVVTGLTGAVLILAAVGFALAVDSPDPNVGSNPSTAAVGSTLSTSYGSYRVASVERSDGLTEDDLGGMTHGINGLVSAGSISVTAEVTVSNDTGHSVKIKRDNFHLLRNSADAGPLAPTGSTLAAEAIPPHSSVDAVVSFIVPADGTPLRLSYQDPGSKVPLVVDLGRTDVVSPETQVPHEH